MAGRYGHIAGTGKSQGAGVTSLINGQAEDTHEGRFQTAPLHVRVFSPISERPSGLAAYFERNERSML